METEIKTELENLSVEHDYYCSESNYYSNEASQSYATMTEFLEDFEESNVDMNLCFRWDIKSYKDEFEDHSNGRTGYFAEVFIMIQRKGIFKPIMIDSVNEEEAVRFRKYAEKHWETIKQIWSPISSGAGGSCESKEITLCTCGAIVNGGPCECPKIKCFGVAGSKIPPIPKIALSKLVVDFFALLFFFTIMFFIFYVIIY